MSKKIKVLLLVDQNPFWHKQLRQALSGKNFRVVSAYNAVEAHLMFAIEQLDIIAIDDCVSGREMDALELVQEFRRGFSGKLIACCSDCNNGDALVKAGCDVYAYKSQLAKNLLQEDMATV